LSEGAARNALARQIAISYHCDSLRGIYSASHHFPASAASHLTNLVAVANIHKALEEAIRTRRQVELRYMDDDGFRVFEPYVLHVLGGMHRVVSGVQVSHSQDKDMANSWGCLEVAQISEVKLREQTFRPHRGFSSFAVERYQHVTCAVDRS